MWAQALGRPVRYAGDDDAALDAALTGHLTGHRLDDWRSSLRKLRNLAVRATPEELATTERLLRRRPTEYTEFVRRVLAEHAVAAGHRAVGAAGRRPRIGIRARVLTRCRAATTSALGRGWTESRVPRRGSVGGMPCPED